MSLLSFVMPVYNEEKSIRPLHARLSQVCKNIGVEAEFIFINDGSLDDSLAVISDLHHQDSRVKLISFTRNFGQQIALTAGLKVAKGDAVITLDADLQHPPEVIPKLWAAWREGVDIVSAVRHGPSHSHFFKRAFSRAFYRVFKSLTAVPLIENSPEFRLLSRRVVQTLLSCPERHRFVRGLIAWTGFRSTAVEFETESRIYGTTGFGFKKMLSMGVDAVISFSCIPLYFAAFAGVVLVLFGLCYLAYILGLFFFTNKPIVGWTSVVSLILIIGGFHMILTAITGVYIGKTFEEVKNRPLFVIETTLGITPPNPLPR